MNILVLIKQTFDTEEKITLQNGKICEDGVNFIINPYDEYAIEEALKLRDLHGGEVTVITIGPERSENALRTALAMGADKAIIVDSEDQELDEHSISKVLAAVIKGRKYDLILGGNMAVDYGSGQVGPRLAEELDIPQITTITYIEVNGNQVIIERDVEGDKELVESSLPVLATAQQGLNEPRYPSLPGIMRAKKKPIERLEIDDFDFEDDIDAKTVVTETYFPPKKDAGRILIGEIKDQVSELANLLRSEAKVL
ncbi:electron transfer flavoprotein beta subunit [Cytobacillus horneckiae]|uniref:Electron transfer flavoprotein subunit beta n=1 Tax=Cytobacillus horneckiae TaxID=549687 RepID=A0A2N0ZKY0_9BACI|nr:electron transfer flavoprotein subunit beta/FixA family protein [Cytobacillus horneckiae]MBN6885592.1 electron transfer flavoprotein subunit beta/FixA family protein [Cytobacillus horneckiae]MEC1156297.1 electron transfer flavoprotein subunit beta/FixA family protein [Cytobacillus horneckiae]MED2938315.1 electron transfer flavoprotein subunit beta/FixA family protein [Cytobacillus horneckiae]PKG30172.1 electron transfer flavoprotein subunit beta [Cytobacillus horneckiae]